MGGGGGIGKPGPGAYDYMKTYKAIGRDGP
jgi:hypothetical protein